MKWFIKVFGQYADFNSRASRREFWMFVLFNFLFVLVWGLVAGLLIGLFGSSFSRESDIAAFIYKLLALYYSTVAVPAIAVTVRRLHDTEHSGWWILIGFIPVVGGLWLLALMCLDGNMYDNCYGSRPDGMIRNILKSNLQQKALKWLIAFGIFGISMILFVIVDIFNHQAIIERYRILILPHLLGNFLVYISFIIMGIAFLQKKDYSRTVGAWILFGFICRLIIEFGLTIKIRMPTSDFRLEGRFILYMVELFTFILYGGLLIARKRQLIWTSYILMAGSACWIIRWFLVKSYGNQNQMLPLDYYIAQLVNIIPIALFVYSFANLTEKRQKKEIKQ